MPTHDPSVPPFPDHEPKSQSNAPQGWPPKWRKNADPPVFSFNQFQGQPAYTAPRPVQLPRSSGVLSWGLFLTIFVAPVITAFALPNLVYVGYFGMSYNEGATIALVCAGLVALIGTICILVGVSRAARTLDYLGEQAKRAEYLPRS